MSLPVFESIAECLVKVIDSLSPSPTHEGGKHAQQALDLARAEIAALKDSDSDKLEHVGEIIAEAESVIEIVLPSLEASAITSSDAEVPVIPAPPL